MAVFFPEIDTILRENPTDAERQLIDFFVKFDNSYEIFFKPFLNGDLPDVILMRKNFGILIIQFFDQSILDYKLDTKNLIPLDKNSDAIELSPFIKADILKKRLINLHFNELFEKSLYNKKYRQLINTLIFLTQNTTEEFEKWYYKNALDKQTWKLFDTKVITSNTLTLQRFERLLNRSGFNSIKPFFDDDLYQSIYRYLKPSFHRVEDGKFINYSDEQIKVLRNPNNAKLRKIKGVSGSGKTLLLAKMAVEENKKTGKKVLILTYNIALRNYIRYQINNIPEDFRWQNFEIINYHEFFLINVRQVGWSIQSLGVFENINFFESVKSKIEQYDSIFIDEIQDYKEEWIIIIKRYFLKEGGTYIVFGDEKQNIYDRELERDKTPKTGVPGGRWNVLEETYRMSSSIIELAQNFQETYFGKKYNKDNIKSTTIPIDYSTDYGTKTNQIIYKWFEKDTSPIEMFNYIHGQVRELYLNPHDVGILGSRVEYIRDLSFYFENIDHERTRLMSESKEEWWRLLFADEQTVEIETWHSKYFQPIWKYLEPLKILREKFNDKEDLYEALKLSYLKSENKRFDEILDRNHVLYEEFQTLKANFEITEHHISKGELTLDFYYPMWINLKNKLVNENLKDGEKMLINKINKNSTVFELYKELKDLDSQLCIKYKKYISYLKNFAIAYSNLKDQLEIIRRNRKLHFKMESDGTMKMSTIHSFKGWEIHSLFLILDDEDKQSAFLTDELVYTAITRARFNIIIMNCGMMKYHEFFNKNQYINKMLNSR